jgi:hypothetical protein
LLCPKCRSRAIGKIGQDQYYCWDCNIEFVPTKDGFRMYRLEEDGTLVADSLDASPHAAVMPGTVQGYGMMRSAVDASAPKDDKAVQATAST